MSRQLSVPDAYIRDDYIRDHEQYRYTFEITNCRDASSLANC